MIQISIFNRNDEVLKEISSKLSIHKNLNIAGTGRNAYDILKFLDNFQPDIIIMDLLMNYINGTFLSPIIKRKSPATKLIALELSENENIINQDIMTGISGYINNRKDLDKLINAITVTYNDGLYVSKQEYLNIYHLLSNDYFIGQTNINRIITNEGNNSSIISQTCGKILSLHAEGYSDKEISDELFISIGTVRNCLWKMRRKTGLKTRAQMVVNLLKHKNSINLSA